MRFELRIVPHQLLRLAPSGFDKARIGECLHAHITDAPLLVTIQITRTARLQVGLGEFESITRFLERFQALQRVGTGRIRK